MSKSHVPACRCDGKPCAEIATCRKEKQTTDGEGVHICFTPQRPQLSGKAARVAYGDGAHCGADTTGRKR